MASRYYHYRTIPVNREEPMNWLEQQFHDTGWFMLFALTALFFALMWIFSGIALLVSRNQIARKKAGVVFALCTLTMLSMIPLVLVHRLDSSRRPAQPVPPSSTPIQSPTSQS